MYDWMVSPDPQPVVASDGRGSTLLVYSRYDYAPSGGGVTRLFARTLDRIGRRRAIR